MLEIGVPNIEMHIYENGRHPGDPLSDGSRMTGGLTDRNGMPFGTWHHRYIDWFRDLGFLQKPGVETKAAKDVATFLSQPPRGVRPGRGGPPGAGNVPVNPGAAAPQDAAPRTP
jgi:endo-1,4-beta-xylanase